MVWHRTLRSQAPSVKEAEDAYMLAVQEQEAKAALEAQMAAGVEARPPTE